MDEIVKENINASLVTREEILTLFQGERRVAYGSHAHRLIWGEAERAARLALLKESGL